MRIALAVDKSVLIMPGIKSIHLNTGMEMNTMSNNYSRCPCCGSNLPVHAGDEGTNSFIPVDMEKVEFIALDIGILNGLPNNNYKDAYNRNLDALLRAIKGE